MATQTWTPPRGPSRAAAAKTEVGGDNKGYHSLEVGVPVGFHGNDDAPATQVHREGGALGRSGVRVGRPQPTRVPSGEPEGGGARESAEGSGERADCTLPAE